MEHAARVQVASTRRIGRIANATRADYRRAGGNAPVGTGQGETDQRVGRRHVVIVQPGPLRPEQDAAAKPPPGGLVDRPGGGAGAQHRFDDVARPGGMSRTRAASRPPHPPPCRARSACPGCGRRRRPCATPAPAASRPAAPPDGGGTGRHSPSRVPCYRCCRPVAGAHRMTTGLPGIGSSGAPPSRPVTAPGVAPANAA